MMFVRSLHQVLAGAVVVNMVCRASGRFTSTILKGCKKQSQHPQPQYHFRKLNKTKHSLSEKYFKYKIGQNQT